MEEKVYIIVLMCLLGSCTNNTQDNVPDIKLSNVRQYDNGIRVIEVEGCEYVTLSRFDDGSGGNVFIIHKGNCKYCIERKEEKQNRK